MTDDITAPADADAPVGAAVDLDDPVVARLGAAIDPPGRLSRAAAWPGSALAARATGASSLAVADHRRRLRGVHLHPAGPGQRAVVVDAGGRRHGCSRVGPGLPPRPPAHVVPAHGLDPGLVRRVPRVPVLHGAALAGDRPAQPGPPVRPGVQAGGHQRPGEPAGGVLGVRQAHPPALPGRPSVRGRRHRLPVRPLVLDLRRQHRVHPRR